MKPRIFGLVLICFFSLFACKKETYTVKDYLEAIRIYTSKHSEVYENVRSFSNLGPRYTGFNESVKVKKWLEEKLKNVSVQPNIQEFKLKMVVKQEHWLRVYSDTLKENILEIPCETFEGLLGVREASAFLTDSSDENPAGKILLWEITDVKNITKKLEEIAKKGVLGIICMYPFSNSIMTAKLVPKNRIHCPVLCVSQEEAMNLKAYNEQKPKRKIRMFTQQSEKTVKSFNMSCILTGESTEKIQVFVHWDSWDISPAVLENGSSIAIALEMIRYIKQIKLPLQKSIEFVFLGASEQNETGWKIWKEKNTLSKDFVFLENMLELDGISLKTNQLSKAQKIHSILKKDYDPSLKIYIDGQDSLNLHVPTNAIRFKNRIPSAIAANIHSDSDNLDMVEETTLMRTAALSTMYIWGLANVEL